MKKASYITLFIFIIGILGYGYQQICKKREYQVALNFEYGKNIREELLKINARNHKLFWLYLRYFHQGGKDIKAGYYEIHGQYSWKDVLSMLEEGRGKYQKITIIEGTPLFQVFELLEEKGIGKAEKYREQLQMISFPYPTPDGNWEGYFYPETYNVPENYTEKDVIQLFLQEFLKHFPEEEYPDKEEFYQKLILASLLEREAKLEEEKPMIASVIENRLKKGMRLEIDSTVNYLYQYQKKRIYYKDLEKDSPYNTYRHTGLPPGPICSPTEKSMYAAYHPAKTDFYFFVTKGEGTHHFTKTYQEHINFQKKYKK